MPHTCITTMLLPTYFAAVTELSGCGVVKTPVKAESSVKQAKLPDLHHWASARCLPVLLLPPAQPQLPACWSI